MAQRHRQGWQDFVNRTSICDPEAGGVYFVGEEFPAADALSLQGAEFGRAFVEEAVRLGTGAIDGELEFGGGFLLHWVRGNIGCVRGERFLDLATAAETPCGSADFVYQIEFERAVRDQGGMEGFGEFGVGFLFAGADKIVGGEEAVGDSVFGGCSFAGFGLGSASRWVEG